MSNEILLEHKLKDGTVVLEREQREQDSLLHFTVDMTIDYPADVVFEQLVLAMVDSERSWIWPIEYEYSPERPQGGVREGCQFKMTYKVPRFDKPEIPAKAVTYTYVLAQYRPENCLFEYRSVDHPLEGGAVVQTLPLKKNQCRLCWKGAYKQDVEQAVVVESLRNYIPFFYGKMEQRIATGPSGPSV